MPSYLHGIEVIEIKEGTRTVQEVKTAIIGLIGIAPTGNTQTPIIVRNDSQAAQFGKRLPGFNIPHALEHILSQGAGTIVVVNVFDPTLHTSQVTDEEKSLANGILQLSSAPIGVVSIKNADGSASTLLPNVDYTIDSFGKFTAVQGKIANGTTLKFSFKKLNQSAVTTSHIIGEVNEQGNRTGIKCFDIVFGNYGFSPKILIAPGYSAQTTIAQALISAAHRLRAIALIDSTFGWTVEEALESRGTSSQFFTSDERAVLLYPYLKAYDEATSSEDMSFPYSSFFAGIMARTDIENGYWFSPSSKAIRGITGTERPISAGLSDPDSDANLLNGAGITTVFNQFGTGFNTWGNRSASFPINASPDSFISLRRIADLVNESLQLASLPFQDLPITQALIDHIRETGNSFMRVLIGRGALLPNSKVVFNKSDNSNEQLAAGQISFRLIFMGPTPAERITFLSQIDISLYSGLK